MVFPFFRGSSLLGETLLCQLLPLGIGHHCSP